MEKSIEKILIPNFDLSISTGTSIYPDEAKTLHDLITLADKKMYREKQSTIPSIFVKSNKKKVFMPSIEQIHPNFSNDSEGNV